MGALDSDVCLGDQDYSRFAEAYNGAERGTPTNDRYASAMRQAAAAYRA